MSTARGTKKIVITRRAPGEEVVEELQALNGTNGNGALVNGSTIVHGHNDPHLTDHQNSEEDSDETDLFRGEIFDQYYHTLGERNTDERLRALAAEPIDISVEAERSAEEREALHTEYQAAAEALAHQLYKLCQKKRETSLDIYLSAFNVVLDGRTGKESYEILRRANEFFSEHYDSLIKERGERPEILSQIVKRTGKESREKLRRIINGRDVEATAQALWNIKHSDAVDKYVQIRSVLVHCSETQVRALRTEYGKIAAKQLCAEIDGICNERVAATNDAEDEIERWLRGDDGTADSKPAVASIYQDYGRVQYIFRGRSEQELAEMQYQYHERFGSGLLDEKPALHAKVEERLRKYDAELVEKLFRPFDSSAAAREIADLLFPESEAFVDTTSDPDELVGGTRRIEEEYIGKFHIRRALQADLSLDERVSYRREALTEKIEYMTPNQFSDLNTALRSEFGFELNAKDFPNAAGFDARSRAAAVKDALTTAIRAEEIIKPLAYLHPAQCLRVAVAYRCAFGSSMAEEVISRVDALHQEDAPEEVVNAVNNRLNGFSRWPLHVDLLEPFSTNPITTTLEAKVWDNSSEIDKSTERAALEIATLLNAEELEIEEIGNRIIYLLRTKSYGERNAIEHAFFDLADPSQPLLTVLAQHLSIEQVIEIEHLLAGFDLSETGAQLAHDIGQVYRLREASVAAIEATMQRYNAETGRDIVETVTQNFSNEALRSELLDALATLHRPAAREFHQLLKRLDAADPQVIKKLRTFWQKPYRDAHAFERAYDSCCGRLRVHLKILASRGLLTVEDFADAILYLEGIDPTVPKVLAEHIAAQDIPGIQAVLGQYRTNQKTVEETFNLLSVEGTFRQLVMGMEVPIDDINETLLHLDSHFARDVGAELAELVATKSGEELGKHILMLIAEPTVDRPNARIPSDVNWISEMRHLIRRAYEAQSGQRLIPTLKLKDVPETTIHEITVQIMGADSTKAAFDMYKMIESEKGIQGDPDGREEKVLDTLATRGTRMRQRVVEIYNDSFCDLPGHTSLREDVERYFDEQYVKDRIFKLLNES